MDNLGYGMRIIDCIVYSFFPALLLRFLFPPLVSPHLFFLTSFIQNFPFLNAFPPLLKNFSFSLYSLYFFSFLVFYTVTVLCFCFYSFHVTVRVVFTPSYATPATSLDAAYVHHLSSSAAAYLAHTKNPHTSLLTHSSFSSSSSSFSSLSPRYLIT